MRTQVGELALVGDPGDLGHPGGSISNQFRVT